MRPRPPSVRREGLESRDTRACYIVQLHGYVRFIPQERVQQLTEKQTVDVPVQQIMESIAEMSQTIHQERVPERVIEQIVDVPVRLTDSHVGCMLQVRHFLSLYGLGCCVVLLVFLCRVYDSLGFKKLKSTTIDLASSESFGRHESRLPCMLPSTLWRKSQYEVAASVIKRLHNTSSWSGSEAECRVSVFLARSHRHCGESPRVEFQRVSSEDHRTPVRGQTVKQSADFRSSSLAPNDVVGKVPMCSCRECHQKTTEHQFVDRQ